MSENEKKKTSKENYDSLNMKYIFDNKVFWIPF